MQSYYKPYIQADVEHHDCFLRASDELPDTWEHQVKENGADEDDIFGFHWQDTRHLAGVDEEHRPFITLEYIPELFWSQSCF